MANDPPSLTPDGLRERGLDDAELFLAHFRPRLLQWARTHLQKVGIGDADTADEVVSRVITTLVGRWTYDPAKGRLTKYLWKVVWSQVNEELRRRARRPGDYGAAAGDKDNLDQLEESFHQSLADLDGTWQRRRKLATRQALARIRDRVSPLDWEVFYLVAVNGRTAPEVALSVNERFRPVPPIEPPKVYRTTYKVREILIEEFRRAGIDPFAEGPDPSELGAAWPPASGPDPAE